MFINKKDIIRINEEIGCDGGFSNESSLDYALSYLKHKKSWLNELAVLTRALLVDHVFNDGNKRTALVLMKVYIEDKDFELEKKKIIDIITQISKKNVTNLNKMMRLLKKCYL